MGKVMVVRDALAQGERGEGAPRSLILGLRLS